MWVEEIRNEKSEERLRALEFLGKLAVYALTKSSSIEKEKAESVAEKLSSNEEQENHNFTALFLPTNTVIHPGYMDPFPANLYDFMIGRFLKTTRTFPAFGRGCLIQACKSAQLYKVMGTSIPQRGEPLKFFLEQIMWYTKPNPLDYTICSYVSLDNPERFQILKRFTTAFPDAKKMPFRMIVLFVLLGLPLPTKWSYPTFYSQLRELLLSYQKEPPFLMEFMRGADSLPSLSKTGDTSRLSIVTMDSSLGLRENMDELMQKSRKENGSLIYAPLDLYQGVR